MQSIAIKSTLSLLFALATPALAHAASGSTGSARPVAIIGQAHSEPARSIATGDASPAAARMTIAMLDIVPPQARATVHRRIKHHHRTARHHKESALQFSESSQGNVRSMIAQHAAAAGVPVALADAVVRIESRYNPHATNAGAMGLMQIKPQTARGMGFSGPASALLQPDTNLRYGMKYLAAAFRDSHGDTCQTVTRYQSGHFSGHINHPYCAKAKAIMAQR